MARYLVELYFSRARSGDLEVEAARACSAAEAMAREGLPVRWLRTIFVPEDETCFYLYEAGLAEFVRERDRRLVVQKAGRLNERLALGEGAFEPIAGAIAKDRRARRGRKRPLCLP